MTSVDTQDNKTNGRWTKEEHQRFLYGLKIYGKNWKKIQNLIETRSSTQIRSHAQKHFIKTKKGQQYDEECQSSQNFSQSKQGYDTMVNRHQNEEVEKVSSHLSFYFERILRNYVKEQERGNSFDLWGSLIDYKKSDGHKSCQQIEMPKQIFGQIKRQNSNIQFSTIRKMQEQPQSSELIVSESSNFQKCQNHRKQLMTGLVQ